MKSEELLKLVNIRYYELKYLKHDLRYNSPEQLKQIKVQSDQVNALIDVIAKNIGIWA